MSDTNKEDPVPGGQNEADEEAGQNPGSLEGVLVPVEWVATLAGIAALLAFQVVANAFEEKGQEEKVAWPATLLNKNIQLLEKEEEEEEEDLMTERYQEVEEYYDSEEEDPDCPEGRVLGAETMYKLGYYFCDLVVPSSLSLLVNEATAYNYEYSDEESEDSEVEDQEEVDENEELRGPKKYLD